ncbi:Flavonoid 3'-monooxygenase [Apostasia shenzhenica]|uniref:Flavonoid 3'-monooxygenase n=1 Tax=Apostasia shenzhenica TaxID=1088818 RepID=A0A2I0B5P5_9ASPA|nr:Flavonoid 3'-monooxygenase [Apostasia shenzhenica]
MAPVLLLLFSFLLACLLVAGAGRKGSRSSRRLPLPPGPKGWPFLGNLPQLGPKPHQTFHALSKTHGPLLHLRLGSLHAVVPSTADLAEKLLRNDMKFINRPKNSGAEHIAYNYQDLGFTPYGPRWRMLRKLCAQHLFSARALDELQHVRRREVAAFVRRLAAAGGPPVDVSREVAACVVNALAQLLVGRRVFDDDAGEDAREFKDMVTELMYLAGSFNVGDFVPWLRWLDLQGLEARMKKLHRKFDGFLDGVIADHPASGSAAAGEDVRIPAARDLLSVLIELKDDADGDGGKLTNIDIKALLQNIFAAGSDSTSITSEWALAELIRHPDVLSRAQEELDAVVGCGRLVSESDLPNLPFLQAVVKETFRLHPPGPLSVPRIAVEDCEVDGYLIPKGATLLPNIWAIGRDPAAWPDSPLEFRPDRFITGGGHEGVDVKGHHFGLLPFGAGRRMCVGLNLGLRMVHLMTATLVHSFNWALPEGRPPAELDMEERANGFTLHKAVPLVACPMPRLAPEVYLRL